MQLSIYFPASQCPWGKSNLPKSLINSSYICGAMRIRNIHLYVLRTYTNYTLTNISLRSPSAAVYSVVASSGKWVVTILKKCGHTSRGCIVQFARDGYVLFMNILATTTPNPASGSHYALGCNTLGSLIMAGLNLTSMLHPSRYSHVRNKN